MRVDQTSDQWWKSAVIYCLDVETYMDSNGDGIGDIPGLIQRLDHIAGLGVTCLWLMPFQPTPNRDDGYDITDYYAVDPRLGTLGDFVELIRTAADRGLRVIVDLVVNHTSDEHPWFVEARSVARLAAARLVRLARRAVRRAEGARVPGDETSNWCYDESGGQYYLHRFYHFQPDLDTANAAVRDEIAHIIGFWLELGVSGFRMDAVPALLETAGLPDHVDKDEPQQWLRSLRAFTNRRRGDALLLGEVNLGLNELARYFGEHGDELHMQFSFLINEHLWLALARGQAEPLETVIRELPAVPPDAGWAIFLRNHDELTLDKLTEPQRNDVFSAFGPEEGMQLYGHGLRRRAAPMLEGDGDRLRLAWSLVFTLPGTPVVLYGDEIGMGEQLELKDRQAVRVPMQWSRRAVRGLLDRPARAARAAPGGQPVRPGQRQRRCPAARPRLAPELDGARNPPAQGEP